MVYCQSLISAGVAGALWRWGRAMRAVDGLVGRGYSGWPHVCYSWGTILVIQEGVRVRYGIPM